VRPINNDLIDQGERFFRELADNAPVMIWRSGLDKLCDWLHPDAQIDAGTNSSLTLSKVCNSDSSQALIYRIKGTPKW